MKISEVKIPYDELLKVNIPSISKNYKYSHKRYTYKLPRKFKGVCDISRDERQVEIYDDKDNRFWIDFKTFFGTIICDAENILIEFPNNYFETMSIYSVDQIKIKRSIYIQLIFERDLPF